MENREVIPTKSGPAGASRHQLSRQKKPLPSMRESLWPLRRREVNGSVPVLSRGLTYPRGEKLLAVMLSPSPRETTTPRRSAYRRSDPIYLIFCARLCLFGCLSTIWLWFVTRAVVFHRQREDSTDVRCPWQAAAAGVAAETLFRPLATTVVAT